MVLTAAAIACGMIVYLAARAFATADRYLGVEHIYGTALRPSTHIHRVRVAIGPEGQGVAGMRCGTCHQDHNLTGQHMPPGARDWHLPSRDMPMIWEGLSDAHLCQLFKDPMQNGRRNVDEIVEHINTPLLLWGWNPGEGRTPIPMPVAEFLAKVKEWASKGTACASDTGR